jgi:hypothetical protein
MKQRPYQQSRTLIFGSLTIAAALTSLGATESFANKKPIDPVAACTGLTSLTKFPVAATQITSAKFNLAGTTTANGVPLPDHCQITGVINQRIGTDGFQYGDMFEVRLPAPAAWNGRFMFQGGGGTEGAVPAATGAAGSLSPTLAHGWAVASQDGGHENSKLPNPNQFYLEKQGTIDQAYHSIDVVAQTAKFLIKSYYSEKPDRSYFVGCSTGGRQGMVFSQHFPDYFDGIIAGDPVYDLEAIGLATDWGVQQIYKITPTPIAKTAAGLPILYPAFPVADQQLFQKALLQACDGLDGTVDGVIDDLKQCHAKFDPATYVFTDTNQPLQCSGAKNASCLSPDQVNAVKKINQGPRDPNGHRLRVPAGEAAHDHADNTILGYIYDGGYMTASGIAGRKIGTPTTAPGDYSLGLGQLPYAWLDPPNPSFDPLTFVFDKTHVGALSDDTPVVTFSTSLDISKFKHHGGKIIWYHGLSDPGPPVLGTINYYNEMAGQNGGLRDAQEFSRLYLVPNMGHCSGGPSTDQFDLLTPLVNWVEKGQAPQSVVASGSNFLTTPTKRSRPLCPYPQEARYVGAAGGDLADANNYKCITPFGAYDRDHDHDHDHAFNDRDRDDRHDRFDD